MFDSILNKFSVDIGIDLGSSNTVVCVQGEGIVLNEPSIVAVHKGTSIVLQNGNAVGLVAKEILGKTPDAITAIRPLKGGAVSDVEITDAMLMYFIRRAKGRRHLIGPRVAIAVPSGLTNLERQALIGSAERAGARRAFLVEESIASAIGAGLPLAEPTSRMMINIGGGTTEIGIISMAGISLHRRLRVAGDDFDTAIMNHLKKTYSLLIGEQMAERIKIEIGSADMQAPNDAIMEVRGRDMISGLPRRTTISAGEVRQVLSEPVEQIIRAITRTLELATPRTVADILTTGITMAGGGSLLPGLTKAISNATGLQVSLTEDPLTCVARGTSIYLSNRELWNTESADHPVFEELFAPINPDSVGVPLPDIKQYPMAIAPESQSRIPLDVATPAIRAVKSVKPPNSYAVARIDQEDGQTLILGKKYRLEAGVSQDPLAGDVATPVKLPQGQPIEIEIVVFAPTMQIVLEPNSKSPIRAGAVDAESDRRQTVLVDPSATESLVAFLVIPLQTNQQSVFVEFYYLHQWLCCLQLDVFVEPHSFSEKAAVNS